MTLPWRFVVGSLVGIVASFPLAALTALVFRFPIPFGGYASGPDAVVPALYAAAFYGILGGFIVQGLLGGIATLIAPRPENRSWINFVAAPVVAAAVGVLILSILDWIIGEW